MANVPSLNKHYLYSHGTTLSDKDFDMLFSSINVDGNGEVSFAEYAVFVSSIANKADTLEEDEA